MNTNPDPDINPYAATHDSLTGLPNEFLFFDRLNQATVIAERGTSRFALLLVVLNDYPQIEQQYGRIISRHLLVKVAERLQEILREPDTISRREDNNFMILLPQIESARSLTQLIWRIEKALSEPLQLETGNVCFNISIGQGFYPDNGATAFQLVEYVEADAMKSTSELS